MRKVVDFVWFVHCSVSTLKGRGCLYPWMPVLWALSNYLVNEQMNEWMMECLDSCWMPSCVWCAISATVHPVQSLKCVLFVKRTTLCSSSPPDCNSSALLHSPKLDASSSIFLYRTCQTINRGNSMPDNKLYISKSSGQPHFYIVKNNKWAFFGKMLYFQINVSHKNADFCYAIQKSENK